MEQNTNFDYKPDEGNGGKNEPRSAALFSWKSSEYIGHERGAGWYILLALGTVLVAAVAYFLTKSYFTAGIIGVLGVIVGVFASRQPHEISYEIDDSGIKIGSNAYSFSQFKSFSISRSGKLSSLNFWPIKRFAPPVSAFFEASQEAKIIQAIGDNLPLEDRKSDSIDRLAHKLKL